MAYALIISRGIKSLPMLKCSSERCVCAPQSLSAATSTSPRLSVSLRISAILFLLPFYELLQNAALVHLLEQFLILSVVHVNADQHGTRSVERLSQGSGDLAWTIDLEACGTECLRVLDRVDRPKINAGDAVVLDAFLLGHHVVAAVDPNHMDQVGLQSNCRLELVCREKETAVA